MMMAKLVWICCPTENIILCPLTVFCLGPHLGQSLLNFLQTLLTALQYVRPWLWKSKKWIILVICKVSHLNNPKLVALLGQICMDLLFFTTCYFSSMTKTLVMSWTTLRPKFVELVPHFVCSIIVFVINLRTWNVDYIYPYISVVP